MSSEQEQRGTSRPFDGPDRDVPASNKSRTPTVLETEALFAGGTELRLRHRGEEYRLRITRQGKLILTK